jgi:hypothetical protein
MNVLILYNSAQTYTNTTFEHLGSFAEYSANRYFYCHCDHDHQPHLDLAVYDAVVLHYSVRLPFDQLGDVVANALEHYAGLKVLFIQDEYDRTYRTWYWLKRIGFQLVFTVVPSENIGRIYPPEEFPDVRFVNNLTGYAPGDLPAVGGLPAMKRRIVVGYRARPLPAHYGQLGREKIDIARLVKQYCESRSIPHDIAWSEEERIYGERWYQFMVSCRAMLGSESGSNVFDWDGTLTDQIRNFRNAHPDATNDEVYRKVIWPNESPGLMNQVSPRIFEAIALRTALVLFEGNYSGVVVPGEHFIPLKKDGSNLDEVFELLGNGEYVDAMTERAYRDVIASGKYSYKSFVRMVDEEIASASSGLSITQAKIAPDTLTPADNRITTQPIRAELPGVNLLNQRYDARAVAMAFSIWEIVPKKIRMAIKPYLRKLLTRE